MVLKLSLLAVCNTVLTVMVFVIVVLPFFGVVALFQSHSFFTTPLFIEC